MLSRLPIAEVPIDISVPGETEVRATEYHHNQHAYLQDFKEGEKVSICETQRFSRRQNIATRNYFKERW